MIFDIDADLVADSVAQELERAASSASEEQFNHIVAAIDKGMPGIIAVITRGMAKHWKDKAQNSPTGWGSKYAAAITYKIDETTGEVFLDENSIDKMSNKSNVMFAKMVEQGMKSFSIKDALLASEKAKTSATGIKYIIVPFPVAAPRKENQGKMASQFGGREMTREMHQIVKSGGRLPAGSTLPSGQDVSGLTKYTTRQRHEGYGIFRMVTENSKGWIHPGKRETGVFDDVVDEANKRIQEVMATFCREIVKEYTSR